MSFSHFSQSWWENTTELPHLVRPYDNSHLRTNGLEKGQETAKLGGAKRRVHDLALTLMSLACGATHKLGSTTERERV